ncbi:MAG: hypothetical protein A2Z04_03540 [Chloroflexi bacterium RBG_16_57_9]|nr:MAG: hypothetical protein A2Z04_03540 [Chloroflexi bacterium RBG_16_57_9]
MRRLSILLSFASLMLLTGIATAEPPDPRFGAVEAFLAPEQATAIRIGWERIFISWERIQPGGGWAWNSAAVLPDGIAERERAAGRELVGLLINTPGWAGDGHTPRAVPHGLFLPFDHPDNLWGRFVARIVAQYRGRIDHWIIWNEPDVWDPDHPGYTWKGSEADFAQLLKIAYLAAKTANPQATVHLPGLTYWWDYVSGRIPYLLRLLDALAADPDASAHGFFFDVATVHAYFKPDQVYDLVQFPRQALHRHGLDKPVWINETNAPPIDDPAALVDGQPFPLTMDEQAAYVIQALAMGLAGGADRIAIYKMVDIPALPPNAEPYGLVRHDGSLRPAFAAYRAAIASFAGTRSATLHRWGLATAVVLDRGPQTTTVLWNRSPQDLRVVVRASATGGQLVDQAGQQTGIKAAGGLYYLTLPGTTCSQQADCFIGGPPLMLVEDGPATAKGLVFVTWARTPSSSPPARSRFRQPLE